MLEAIYDAMAEHLLTLDTEIAELNWDLYDECNDRPETEEFLGYGMANMIQLKDDLVVRRQYGEEFMFTYDEFLLTC